MAACNMYITELPNLFLVGASAGYPSVPGVIGNGMDIVELLGTRIAKLSPTDSNLTRMR
jgi:all-trans-retinol 13,14-reductase